MAFTGNSGGSRGLDALQVERLLVSPERDFDSVLVWSFSRLSRNVCYVGRYFPILHSPPVVARLALRQAA